MASKSSELNLRLYAIQRLRNNLFSLKHEQQLTSKEWELARKWTTNVYEQAPTRQAALSGTHKSYYPCLEKRRGLCRSEPVDESQRKRKKTKLEHRPCPTVLKVTKFPDGTIQVCLSEPHTHTLDWTDSRARSDGLAEAAKELMEVHGSNGMPAVFRILKQQYALVGGAHTKRHQVSYSGRGVVPRDPDAEPETYGSLGYAPAVAAEPYAMTAVEALRAFQTDKLTVEAYAHSLLAHILSCDSTVKAWAYLNPFQVLEQARALDAVPKDRRGPLHGVAVGIKDVIYTKGMPTQHGSAIYEDDQPEVDAASVIMLRKAGALILGKTTTTEFASTSVGPRTCNPHDTRRTPGGSSSGSGAAVADFQVPLALGTQTGGSIIRPASFNGTLGFKPTWNSISREGQKFCSVILDTLGFFARSLEDLELLAQVFGIRDDGVSVPISNGVEGLKIGFCKTMHWDHHAGPGTQSAMETGVGLLRAAGAEVEEVVLSEEFAPLPEWHTCIMLSDGRVTFRPEYQSAKDQLAPALRVQVEEKHGYSRRDYTEALDGVAALRPKWDAIAERYAVVVVPSVPDEAPVGLGFTGNMIFNSLWTALHVPVLNIPAFQGPNGLPVGLTLTMARYKDLALLNVAKEVSELWMKQGGLARLKFTTDESKISQISVVEDDESQLMSPE